VSFIFQTETLHNFFAFYLFAVFLQAFSNPEAAQKTQALKISVDFRYKLL